MSPDLPPVVPSVTAELVAALSPRLRKRLDAGVTKLLARPITRDGDTVRVAVDDATDLVLHAPGGAVTGADAIHCGCLLAPDCLHRAAAASAAPVADETPPETREVRETASSEQPGSTTDGTAADADVATPAQHTAAREVFDAAAAVLEAGTDGAGAVLQAQLLHAAHTARLAGLPRASAAAVSVVTAVRAARTADPAYRLPDLADALADVLGVAHRLPHATGADLAALRGTVRQPYRPDGSLRLYGLFSEPVLTDTGYAGAVTWTADADGRLYTVSDVAPGGPARATGAADRTVRIGDTALTHRELSRAGLAVSGATVSPTGRLGAGAGVRAVRASGAAWHSAPLDRLWSVPAAEQVARALGGGQDLLFLEVTLVGTVRESTGDCLLADCGGVSLRLAAAHDDPALPYRDNLRLLAAAGGSRLRIVARLAPGPYPRALLLAAEHPTDSGARVDLGLDRMQRADLAAGAVASPSAAVSAGGEAPLHVVRRRVHQTVSGGRRVLSFNGDARGDAARLRRHGLATAADLLDDLLDAAADRSRDPFGRLLPTDPDRFARSWLAAAVYTDTVERTLCAHAWSAPTPEAPALSTT
ncbi:MULTISPECIES: hypothetical protein [unclassified Streptomyces]|uniref:hypothetical protein n=1 Tax=unclassified Streptomyces TaxID=2593676 RepID=UPI000F71E76D|nr:MULTISPECIES: hypothetical protein [unclassified Streptomyces]AZM64134.1 hypothetical protein DLM49_35285 [Streptomyces sp. WAC 01438]RSM87329.1 hypothetical protein DMA10_35495 [Streptomyces sp. WAC 01420]